MITTRLRFIFLVTLVIILTSSMTTASTSSEFLFLKGTANGLEDTGSIELAYVYYEDTAGYAYGVFVSGDYAYVAASGSGLAVIDISNPTNPGTPVYEDTTGYAYGVFVSGDYAYVAASGSGLAVIDISDPTNPGTPVYEDTTGYAYGVFVSGDYAYVADSDSGLAVIDISDPTNPGTPVYEDTTDSAIRVFVSGGYAYVAASGSGLAVIDISDPTNPGTPVYEDTTGSAYGVFVSGDYAYVADQVSGLAVIQTSTITGAESGPPMAVLVIGGGVAIIAIMVVLFIVRSWKQGDPTRGTLGSSGGDVGGSTLMEATEVLHVAPDVKKAAPNDEIMDKPLAIDEALAYEPIEEPLTIYEAGVQALRGGEFASNRLRFKVKVLNNTANVITDVTVTLSSFPRDSLKLEGDISRVVPKIDPMGFRSPSFEFLPTQDCVRGTVVASVSYVDHRSETHLMVTEPYTVRAVCDLLTPENISPKDFDLKLTDFDHGEITLKVEEWTPEEMQSKTHSILDTCNFFEVASKTENVGDNIELRVTGWAKGKYTGKNIGVEIMITGQSGIRGATCKIRMSGEDEAMIMPAIDEIGKNLSAWLCPMCGGRLPVESVGELKAGRSVSCPFCRVTIDR